MGVPIFVNPHMYIPPPPASLKLSWHSLPRPIHPRRDVRGGRFVGFGMNPSGATEAVRAGLGSLGRFAGEVATLPGPERGFLGHSLPWLPREK